MTWMKCKLDQANNQEPNLLSNRFNPLISYDSGDDKKPLLTDRQGSVSYDSTSSSQVQQSLEHLTVDSLQSYN